MVVSTWVGNPISYLEALCRSMELRAAGWDYDLFLTANGLDYVPPSSLKARFQQVFVRENVGYNLGAWDYAWRRLPEYDRFLFLQDDCLAVRRGWVAAFVEAFRREPTCGLVGEHLSSWWDKPWDELEARQQPEPGLTIEERPASRARFYRETLRRWGIPEGATGRHLTSVVQFTSRSVLEEVGGYRLGTTYHEAIAAEIGFSRAVEARGYTLAQVGGYRHRWVAHREWPDPRLLPRLWRSVKKRVGWLGT